MIVILFAAVQSIDEISACNMRWRRPPRSFRVMKKNVPEHTSAEAPTPASPDTRTTHHGIGTRDVVPAVGLPCAAGEGGGCGGGGGCLCLHAHSRSSGRVSQSLIEALAQLDIGSVAFWKQ